MPVLAESTGDRGSKDPFTHFETAWNAVSDSHDHLPLGKLKNSFEKNKIAGPHFLRGKSIFA
jgi:hypothetical protein